MKAFATIVAAGAIALGYPLIGLEYPTMASADPNNGSNGTAEWDIGAYDFCMKNHPPLYTIEDVLDHHRWCCESTGGVWGANGCQAPPGQLNAPTDPYGGPTAVAPTNIQAPPPPVNPGAPINPGRFG